MEDKSYKFVKQDEISSLLDSIIKKENKDYRYEYPVSVFDPSHVTECPRRMIYRASGCTTENPFSYPSIYNELFAKRKWMEYFSKCKPIKGTSIMNKYTYPPWTLHQKTATGTSSHIYRTFR